MNVIAKYEKYLQVETNFIMIGLGKIFLFTF